jgi:peroxiredoxin
MDLEKELKAVTDYVRQQAGAEVVSTMEAATRRLAESGFALRALGRGQRIPDFELPDATGRTVRSADLLAKGPLVLSFYRGHWCPYCNLELKALQRRLPEIRAKGATLVGISPQTPDQSLSTQQKNELEFPVLSDRGNQVARRFGLAFKLDASLEPIYRGFGVDLQAHNGDDSKELPVPATYVIAADGTVVDVYVDVDYRRRLDPDVILDWLDRVRS